MAAIAYQVTDLIKRYRPQGPPANDGISLEIRQGEVFGLLGPNGAGKSTLVRQLASLTRPTSGQIRLYGRDVAEDPQWAGQWIAVQPQGLALPVQSKPTEVLPMTGRLRGLSREEALRQTEELLTDLGIAQHSKKRLVELSGGQRRLVAIASTLIGNRPVLIFDEPTNDLDPEVRRVVWERIRTAAQQGSTVILVTHNVVEAEQALDRVGIIKDGRLLAMGTPGELKARVSRQIRLELVLNPTVQSPRTLLGGLADAMQQYGAHRYAIIVPREEAKEAIASILPALDQLSDLRIVTPNLEDVYLTLSGGERLGH